MPPPPPPRHRNHRFHLLPRARATQSFLPSFCRNFQFSRRPVEYERCSAFIIRSDPLPVPTSSELCGKIGFAEDTNSHSRSSIISFLKLKKAGTVPGSIPIVDPQINPILFCQLFSPRKNIGMFTFLGCKAEKMRPHFAAGGVKWSGSRAHSHCCCRRRENNLEMRHRRPSRAMTSADNSSFCAALSSPSVLCLRRRGRPRRAVRNPSIILHGQTPLARARGGGRSKTSHVNRQGRTQFPSRVFICSSFIL